MLEADIEMAQEVGDTALVAAREKELYRYPLPLEAAHVWRVFLALHRRRQRDQGEPLPVPWSEVDRYASINGVRFTTLELALLEACEDVYLEYRATQGRQDEDEIPQQELLDEDEDEQLALEQSAYFGDEYDEYDEYDEDDEDDDRDA